MITYVRKWFFSYGITLFETDFSAKTLENLQLKLYMEDLRNNNLTNCIQNLNQVFNYKKLGIIKNKLENN